MSNLSIIRSLPPRRNHSQLTILYGSDGGHFKAARNGYIRYHYAKYVFLVFEVVRLLEQSHSDICFVTPTGEKPISNRSSSKKCFQVRAYGSTSGEEYDWDSK